MTGRSGDPDVDDVGVDRETVAIPARLLERVDDRVARTEFASRDEYVAYVLEHVLARVETEGEEDRRAIDDAEVEQRLESLGYLS